MLIWNKNFYYKKNIVFEKLRFVLTMLIKYSAMRLRIRKSKFIGELSNIIKGGWNLIKHEKLAESNIK